MEDQTLAPDCLLRANCPPPLPSCTVPLRLETQKEWGFFSRQPESLRYQDRYFSVFINSEPIARFCKPDWSKWTQTFPSYEVLDHQEFLFAMISLDQLRHSPCGLWWVPEWVGNWPKWDSAWKVAMAFGYLCFMSGSIAQAPMGRITVKAWYMEQVNYNQEGIAITEHMGINLFYYIFPPKRIFEFLQRKKTGPLVWGYIFSLCCKLSEKLIKSITHNWEERVGNPRNG